jgi:hypothetical protein
MREDNAPFSQEEYEDAKKKGYDLNNWDHYVEYFDLGEVDEETGQRVVYP